MIVTSNRVRELSEALRRRCLYLYISYPEFEKELQIVRSKVPGIVESTLGIVLKDWQDIRHAQDSLSELFEKVGAISKLEDL